MKTQDPAIIGLACSTVCAVGKHKARKGAGDSRWQGGKGFTELNRAREMFLLRWWHLSKAQREIGRRAGINDLEVSLTCFRSTKMLVGLECCEPRVNLRR